MIAYINGQGYAGGAANRVRVGNVVDVLSSAYTVKLYPSGGPISKFRNGGGWLASIVGQAFNAFGIGSTVTEWLDGLPAEPTLVVLYGTEIRFVARVGRWCRRNAVPLVLEVVDWYAVRDVRGAVGKMFAFMNGVVGMRVGAHYAHGVVAASRFLQNFFDARGIFSVRVPAVMTPTPGEVESNETDRVAQLTITYAGSINSREGVMFANLDRLVSDGLDVPGCITINILGSSDLAERESEDGSIRVHELGQMGRESVISRIAQSDFTLLQRPSGARFAQAGFPSKIAESLMAGTAVISNLTSDLGDYLRDGENAILLNSESYGDLRLGLKRAYYLHKSNSLNSRSDIARDADLHFGTASVADKLVPFMDEIVQRAMSERRP